MGVCDRICRVFLTRSGRMSDLLFRLMVIRVVFLSLY